MGVEVSSQEIGIADRVADLDSIAAAVKRSDAIAAQMAIDHAYSRGAVEEQVRDAVVYGHSKTLNNIPRLNMEELRIESPG